MHLIDPLTSGLRGAENGHVELYRRGTTTRATWYPTFEASTSNSSGDDILLDANGSVVVYVNEFVTVLAFDIDGALVREFVAGSADSAIEVISPSFTGTDYVTGASGANLPTTQEAVNDRWFASAGAIDFNVLAGGGPLTIQAAFAASALGFFNVKSPVFGALGDGIANDGSAIAAAITAAAGGGVVFFPPGTYRITAAITLPYNVSLLGSGALATFISVDGAAINGITCTGSGSNRAPRFIRDLAIRPAQNNTGNMIGVGAAGQSLVVDGVAITGGAGGLNGSCINTSGATAPCALVVQNSLLETNGTANCIRSVSGAVDIRAENCYLRSTNAASGSMIDAASGEASLSAFGCVFDAPNSTTGYVAIQWDLSVTNGVSLACVVGCRFPNALSGAGIAINMAGPGFEFGNTMGSNMVVRRSNAWTDATGIDRQSLGSLNGSRQRVAVTTTTHTIPEGIGQYYITYTAAGDLTLTLPSAAQTGRELVLLVHNDTGTPRTIVWPAATRPATALAIAANTFSVAHLRSVYVNGVSYWTQEVIVTSQAE